MKSRDKMALITESDEAVELLDVLRNGPVGVSSTEDIDATRAALVPRLEQRIAALPEARARLRTRRSHALWWSGTAAGLALAAGITLAFFVRWDEHLESSRDLRQAELARTSDETPWVTLMSGSVKKDDKTILAGEEMDALGRLATGDEEATLRGSIGYHLTLGAHSKVELPQKPKQNSPHSVLRLEEGSASFQVLPLPAGSTFSVVTHDARVTVVGTAFSVQTQGGRGTCVKVTEGKVRVQSKGAEQMLTRGQSSGCDEVSQVMEKQETAERATPVVSAKVTTLAEQNKLLSEGLAAERQGKHGAARSAYVGLLRSYPDSAFAEDARAGLARLKASDQPAE